jgi:hypothetical protein
MIRRALLTLPVRGHHVHVRVRTGRLAGQYTVDSGFEPTPDGGLHRVGGGIRAVGRRAAVRAAQHSAVRHRTPHRTARMPQGDSVPFGHGAPELRPPTTMSGILRRHAHGTYVLQCPAFVCGEEWTSWREYGYRSWRDALGAYQCARRYLPDGAYTTIYRSPPAPDQQEDSAMSARPKRPKRPKRPRRTVTVRREPCPPPPPARPRNSADGVI